MRSPLTLALLFAAALLAGCMSKEGHQAAYDGSIINRQLTEARNEEFRELILSTDARERGSMDRELDLIYDREVLKAEHRVELAIQAVQLSTDSRPSLADLQAAIQEGRKSLAEARESISKLRASNTAQLNKELAMWLNDPKARQQLRIADILAVYSKTQADSAVFIEEVLGKVGVKP